MRWLTRLRPFLPWLSLATGVAGALLMNRAPGRAWIVVAAAVLGWVSLVVVNVVERRGALAGPGLHERGARFAIHLSNQIAVQQALLFPLPFYVRAALFGIENGQREHLAFFTIYAAALVVAMWDPLFERTMKGTLSSLCLQAFAVFVGLDMVLPVLGLSNESALFVAGAGAAVAAPLAMLIARGTIRVRDRFLAVGAAVVVIIAVRVAAPLVPPAPLELLSVGIGTRVEDHELKDAAATLDKPDDLICHSAIKAPLGLQDALVHVWKKDGARFDEVRLDVKGGRDAGFRTWSKEHTQGPGEYLCSVETALGQVLGTVTATVR